ncbi:hypothetical protein PSPO01_13735 [Paraphaeosphaeria sporulosa]
MASAFPARAPNPCYRQDYYRQKSGEIPEADYFHAIFMHLVEDGVYHTGDGTIRNELEDMDPLGYNSKPFENLFAVYRSGDVDDIELP